MPDASRQAFGEWLKTIRTNAGMTQAQLASAVGTDGPHVINWEKGRSIPGGANLVRILRACGVQIVAATDPPPLPAQPPENPADLARAVEALAAQTALLVEMAQKLSLAEPEDREAPLEEEASG